MACVIASRGEIFHEECRVAADDRKYDRMIVEALDPAHSNTKLPGISCAAATRQAPVKRQHQYQRERPGGFSESRR